MGRVARRSCIGSAMICYCVKSLDGVPTRVTRLHPAGVETGCRSIRRRTRGRSFPRCSSLSRSTILASACVIRCA
jgi:hypothetical protein